MRRSRIIQRILAEEAQSRPKLTPTTAVRLAKAIEAAIIEAERASVVTSNRPTVIVAAPVERDGVIEVESVETVTVKHGEARVKDGVVVLGEEAYEAEEDLIEEPEETED